MINLNVFSEDYTNGYLVETLIIITLGCISSSVLVVSSNNPIISVLFLIGLFVLIAVYLAFIGITFMGIVYILVYVGAVSVLFLSTVMLVDVKAADIRIHTANAFILVIMICLLFSDNMDLSYDIDVQLSDNIVWNATSQSWDGYLAENNHITSIGNIMYTSFSIWLIITSIILLLAMVGAIVITIKPESNATRRDIL